MRIAAPASGAGISAALIVAQVGFDLSNFVGMRKPGQAPAIPEEEHEGLVGVLVAMVEAHLPSPKKQNGLVAMHSTPVSRVLQETNTRE